MNYKLIAAVCKGGGIGKNNTLPWKIKEDMIHFSKLTRGNGNNAVVMGRKTWESLPRGALIGRDNIILSNTMVMDENIAGNHVVKTCQSIDDVNKFCLSKKYDLVWVVGGTAVYKIFLETGLVDVCAITYIDKEFSCDASFPQLDKTWKLAGTYPMPTSQNYPVELRKLVKR
jgi:dihydrofolate reductase